MDIDWTQAIQRESTGGEMRFDFPRRPMGALRWGGLLLVLFGLVFVWMPAHECWKFIQQIPMSHPGLVEYFGTCFEFMFVLAGCVPLAFGLALICGRCRVEWRDGRLTSTEIVGPFWWKRRLPRKPVRTLEVGATQARSGNSPATPLDNFSALMAVFEDGTRKLVVFGYPKDWLVAVANELKVCAGGMAGAGPAVTVVAVADHPNDADVEQRPANSTIELVPRGSGIQITVPPPGVWKGSGGLMFFALLWNGFMGFITVMFFLPGTHRDVSIGIFLLIISGFWLVGIAIFLFAMHLGRRRAELTAESGRLSIRTEGIFGAKTREWSRSEIAAIRADASGMEVNERPVLELQIHPLNGKKAGFLAGRGEMEVKWLATELRRVLKVPARTSG